MNGVGDTHPTIGSSSFITEAVRDLERQKEIEDAVAASQSMTTTRAGNNDHDTAETSSSEVSSAAVTVDTDPATNTSIARPAEAAIPLLPSVKDYAWGIWGMDSRVLSLASTEAGHTWSINWITSSGALK